MTHRFDTRVFYEDTDMAGIVYHANYLKFIERARSDWVAGLGIDQRAMLARGEVFAVHRIEAAFHLPARFDDRLVVESLAVQAGAARLVLDQRVLRGEACLFDARVTLVCLGPGGRPRRLPAGLAGLVPPG
ncbi:YbgC/FadM family acyl-CoA thioesterase [Pararhodobacter sp. SW119]|uniref:YbgC/FadM family acyl-CoA thioesterase n=1 Tax=Pararhodobacter sp. SW119 TaxID=2780075 RepID=UPI001ADFFE5D